MCKYRKPHLNNQTTSSHRYYNAVLLFRKKASVHMLWFRPIPPCRYKYPALENNLSAATEIPGMHRKWP